MTDDRLLAAKKKFSRLLKEILQFDCADLDFGIYRILAMRRAELEKFLDDELLPQVESILASAAGDRASVQSEVAKLEEQLRGMGVSDFGTVPKWNELRGTLAASPDVAVLTREVFSDLTTFFARYYDEGDFMALPRYKGDIYAIPYDGSEVKLHWANADQYYIKTTEQHADYTAVLDGVDGLDKPRLRFRLAAAETDRDNNKSGEKRRYVLRSVNPVEVGDSEITVWFEFRVPEPGSGRQPTQNALCEEAEKNILHVLPTTWQAALSKKAPQSPEKYTVLGYQLFRYTKKYTSDYFIHKDLGRFLRRELDFFIKNEVLFLEDLEGRSSAHIDVVLQKVKAIRAIGGKIIDWLAQIEDFQRRLYSKRKFVIATQWLVPVALVPDELLTEIAANDAQREEWVRLLGIDSFTGDLLTAEYTAPLNVDFLRSYPSLMVNTAHFSRQFCQALVGRWNDVDATTCGILMNGENWQALNLLADRFGQKVTSVFIDPPYNTGVDGFPYKDNYQHSSWLTMMRDRLVAGRRLMAREALFFATIDFVEVSRLRLLCDSVFGDANFVADVAWEKRYTRSNNAKLFYSLKDTVLIYRNSSDVALLREPRSDKSRGNYTNPDGDSRGPWISSSYVNPAPKSQRPNLVYPIVNPITGEAVEHPTHAWKYDKETHRTHVEDGRLYWGSDGGYQFPRLKSFLSEARDGMVPVDLWPYKDTGTTDDGGNVLKAKFGSAVFDNPKPPSLVRRAIKLDTTTSGRMLVLDFFAGSGTTGEAVIELVRESESDAGFVLVEMGAHFDNVLLPRIIKVAFAADWKDGRATMAGPALYGPIKYQSIESYDDALEGIALARPNAGALFDRAELREDYTLRYMLKLEAEGSLLNLERFRKPWNYTIRVRRDGVVQDSPVDLVETFNYLIGLRVKRYDTYGQEGLLFVHGTDFEGKRVIVIWRDCDVWPNDRLEEKCRQAFESFRPAEFDLVYVNGDNHLPIIKTGEESWKVNLIEETFHARMFDTSDVE